MHNIIVFISGTGTNLQAIIDECQIGNLNAKISCVISNKDDAFGLTRAENHNIPCKVFPNPKKSEKYNYDSELADFVNNIEHDIIILAGFMHILSNSFLNKIKKPIINLHPALPGYFKGPNAIDRAFAAYQKGNIPYTGVMVHHVISKIDSGDVINFKKIPIYKYDTIDTLSDRIKSHEKPLLISAIKSILERETPLIKRTLKHIYTGKVRELYDLGYDMLLFEHTDNQSAFDRHICKIPKKGKVLTAVASWWFEQTKHIIDNHYINSNGNYMIVKKCEPFKIEVVVRAFMTGSTNTSLWTHYQTGERNYCGIRFRDGYVKNQQLDYVVITPTTKGDTDELITADEIINRGLATDREWNYISKKAYDLFIFGQFMADKKGLILVDTKYEFGKDKNGNILLIDEIHTCDSSRFWLKKTYQEKFEQGLEPDKFDKDVVRNFINSKCDPYNEPLPIIPKELINKVESVYIKFAEIICGYNNDKYAKGIDEFIDYYFEYTHNPKVVIVAGSITDEKWCEKIKYELYKKNIYSEIIYSSAHKEPKTVIQMIDSYNLRKQKIVYVAVAGMSNALGGVLSANSNYPVINCPPFKDKIDLMTNINSSLQNPSKVPAMLVLSPGNVALAVEKIFNIN